MDPHSKGAYTHYNKFNCKGMVPINKVRTNPHHPIRTYFPNPNRKSYVIENRTHEDQLMSIVVNSSKPSASYNPRQVSEPSAWETNEHTKFFILSPFSDETFVVNTSQEPHQYVRVHDKKTKQVIDSKFLFPQYSLISVFKDLECRPRLQVQKTPLF